MGILITIFSLAKKLDKIFFWLINNDSHRRMLDPVMVVLRSPYTWIPVYIFLLSFSMTKMKRNALPFILLSLLVLIITEMTCSYIFKPLFERLRPCNDPELSGLVRVLVDCGDAYSFPSSYAARHFGFATFWFYYTRKTMGKNWLWVWAWAAAIGYAQIYVGQDFPADMIAGALLGLTTGLVVYFMRDQLEWAGGRLYKIVVSSSSSK